MENSWWDEYAIVDDSAFDRLICNRVIRRQDLTSYIGEYETGADILLYVQSEDRFKAKNLLIWLDLNMPVMDGFIFLDYLMTPAGQKIADRLKVIVVTSSTREDDKTKAFSYPMVVDYFQKPLITLDLESAMIRHGGR